MVVADLQNQTAEPLFDDALDMALRVGLEQSQYVNLMSQMQIDRALVRMQRPGERVTRELATEIALREGARAVKVIQEEGERIERLVGDLLDLARFEAGGISLAVAGYLKEAMGARGVHELAGHGGLRQRHLVFAGSTENQVEVLDHLVHGEGGGKIALGQLR